MINEQVTKDFLVNRDETGREILYYPETGKKYYVEYIEPRNWRINWGDVNPATKQVEGSYGDKFTGAIRAEESIITKENGFNEIVEGEGGSPYYTINEMHNKWKKENGY